MKLGYIVVYDLELNPHLTEKFKFQEATCTRKVNTRGDKVYSKMLLFPEDYEDVVENARIMKEDNLIIVREPFLLDDELREKVIRWVEWANKADPKEYDLFA